MQPVMKPSDIAVMAEALRQSNERLDYSPASLTILDQLLESSRAYFNQGQEDLDPSRNEERLRLILMAGAYFGEVLRKSASGQWHYRTASLPFVKSGGYIVFPFTRTYYYLQRDSNISFSSLSSLYFILSRLRS
jgi:hypothetical protein